MTSDVFFVDMRAGFKLNMPAKLELLLDAMNMPSDLRTRDLVCIKLHFGEKGNTAYIPPVYVRKVVDKVKSLAGKPFLCDANTLYVGTRSDSVSHLTTALENGFAYAVVGAPVIIADGLKGASFVEVHLDREYTKTAYVAADIMEADYLISLAHFKCHELTGFGGALKNIGMGGGARRGKLDQHSNLSPKVDKKKCIGCEDCVNHCAQHAFVMDKNKSHIDPEKCVGCGECILVCLQGAIQIQWSQEVHVMQKKMVDYAEAILKHKKGKTVFINFLTSISPACDCYGHADAPIVTDVGILASRDPIALDQASADLVNRQAGRAETMLKTNLNPGDDKFRGVYPNIDWEIQLAYGQEIGLGVRSYRLIKLPVEAEG
ncbi:MAG: DUF362 domain-containing protein [Deltaproteobacteria bacterium]|nr:DUF362 domain-containing protein [Deltaproteobacteria bacterium]